VTNAADIVDYYDVFEAALASMVTTRDEYRRHFGTAVRPAPAGYCWFKTVTAPERHPVFMDWLYESGIDLQNRLLAALPRLKPRRLVDVGCGNGGLLRCLTRDYPDLSVTGINLQPTQVKTARALLKETRAEVLEGDFFVLPLEGTFDVACFMESAFHMPDKVALGRRLAQTLRRDGEAWFIDILVAERAAEMFQNVGGQGLFSFVPRQTWQESFRASGLEELEFVDLSREASQVLQVSDVPLLEREYFRPRLAQALPAERTDAAVAAMTRIATEYRRLSRLLRADMLQYVLMRYRKVTS
jgi:2-polyprenyl-3-methyl-5-hydroxy-6-metoxy-1,4-benzoquinol methylase